MQQLPHQHGGELRHLHDEPRGGERQPLRRLSQRLLHGRRHQGRAGHGVLSPVTWRPAAATASPVTPARRRASPAGRAARTPIRRPTPIARAVTTARRRPGMTTPPHIPVTGVQCSNCHTNTAASFVTYTMNHAAVSASRCDACHNGSYTAEGTKGAQGTASYAGHVATSGRTASPVTPARPRPSPAGRAAPTPTSRPTPIARAVTTARPRPARPRRRTFR